MAKKPVPVPRVIDPRMPRWWEALIAVLTVLSIGLVIIEWGSERKGELQQFFEILWNLDLGVCAVFALDFLVRLARSEDRLMFLRRNWIDLVGAMPVLGPLRAVRIVRLVRIIRLARTKRTPEAGSIWAVLPPELSNVATALIVIWVTTSGLMFYFEAGANEHVEGFDDALWWGMATLSTVGYGDVYPVTHAGRLIATITMVIGIGVLGTLAATIATALIELRERGRRGLRSYKLKDHLLVLGWNTKAGTALDDFRLDPRYAEMPVVVVADTELSPTADPTVRFVRGLPSRRDTLERARASRAAAAMVFAQDPADPRSDHQTALTVLALRKINPTIKIGAELVDPSNHEHLEEVGCDAVIDLVALGAMLLVRGVQDVGVTEVIEDLLTNAGGSELYRVVVPDEMWGKTYRDYALAMMESECAVIGLARGETRMLNPSLDERIVEGDHAFVVAKEPP